jgi:RNA-directed DNA polymerase
VNEQRQKIQLKLAFAAPPEGEAQRSAGEGAESGAADRSAESLAETARLMEEICEEENLREAYRRVKANKGGPGMDGMTVRQLGPHLKQHWLAIREQLLRGAYQPQPVKRVEIPKPNGGVRKLGIPTVQDRFVQQAVMQVLQRQWDRTFSERSYGFRPRRSAHQAIAQAQEYQAEGYGWVVDLDLEKFFDRVNHDRLMARIAERVSDKRLLKLIRAFLTAGVMEGGLASPSVEGTPQGGPLSPLLSNLVLDELDRELERRGHRFVRYADDCNIYVRSERAGQRVMASITRYVTRKLKLKVNESKSAVGRPQERKFLGFSFTWDEQPRRRIAPEAVIRLKRRVREITSKGRGQSMDRVAEELACYLRGWRGYFGFCETASTLRRLDSWIRRRVRCAFWKQWKTARNRLAELTKRGVGRMLAAQTAGSRCGAWRVSESPALHLALSNAYLKSFGVPPLAGP